MNIEITSFFYLSGELDSKGLPTSEIISILKSVNIPIKNIQKFDQVLLITTDTNICELITKRAAYLHKCGKVLFKVFQPDIDSILREIKNLDFYSIFKKRSSFAVRIKRIKSYFPKIIEEQMEREIGKIIKSNSIKKLKVDLTKPDIKFQGFLTENCFIFGIQVLEGIRKKIRQRAPHTRPFFHPCGLDPFLARAMVNLSEANGSKTIIDPFCGSGSILIEAALLGFNIIGGDVDIKMLKGSILNLRGLNLHNCGIFRFDARNPCLNQIDCLVTDPPYGRSTHVELGRSNTIKNLTSRPIYDDLNELLAKFFLNNVDLIQKGSLCVISLPSTLEIRPILGDCNFRIQQKFEYFIHRSLTREIIVLSRM
ncbi:MAG: THUMP domain-containing protein [Candidatus Helarchaeota archaeon]